MKREKLIDIYTQAVQDYSMQYSPFDAIYSYATDNTLSLPTWFDVAFKNAIDYEYIFNRSGEKIISNYQLKLYDFYKKLYPNDSEDSLLTKTLENIASSMYYKFIENWDKLHSAIFADYNPIENYNSLETITRSGDDKTSINTDQKQTSKTSAFNSSSMLDNAEVDTSGNATNNYSKTDYNSKVKTEKSGNIGVTSSQDMINQEIELRKIKFFDLLFDDVDTMFVSNLYFYKD